MCEAGFKKSAEQCWDKAKKLMTEYKKVKGKHRKTVEDRKKVKIVRYNGLFILSDQSLLNESSWICVSYDVYTISMYMYMIKIKILFCNFKKNESMQSTMNEMSVLESMVKGSFSNYLKLLFCS